MLDKRIDRRCILLVWIVLFALVLGGCWDYVDLERRSLIMGIGVEVDPDDPTQLRLLVEAPVPAAAEPGADGGGSSDMKPKVVASVAGVSLLQAGNTLRGQMERHPLWGQVVSIVVSDAVARDGIAPVADAIMRFDDLNVRVQLYIVEGSAEDVLQFTPNMQPIASRYLRGLAEQFPVHPKFPKPRAFVLVHRELSEKLVTLVPKLTLLENGRPRMEGAAVLSDGKLVGWLDAEQAEGVNWIRGWLKRSLVQFQCPGHPAGTVAAWVRLDHHRIRTTVDGELPRFDVEISVSARLVDLSRCPLVPEHKPDEERIAQALIAQVTDTIEATIHRAQIELQADFLGLGEQWRRHYPMLDVETDWKRLFPHVAIAVKVDMTQTGISFPGQIRRTVPYR